MASTNIFIIAYATTSNPGDSIQNCVDIIAQLFLGGKFFIIKTILNSSTILIVLHLYGSSKKVSQQLLYKTDSMNVIYVGNWIEKKRFNFSLEM
jgi:hypothetical protein